MLKKRLFPLVAAVILIASMMAGCAQTDGVAVKVGDFELLLSELNFSYRSQIKSLESYYGSYDTFKDQEMEDGKTFDETLKLSTVVQMVGKKIVEQLYTEAGLSFTDEKLAEIEANYAGIKNNFASSKEYKDYLYELGLVDEQMFELLKSDERYYAYAEYLFGEDGVNKVDEAAIRDDIAANYVRVKHVLVKFAEGETELTGDQKTKYDEVYAKAIAGDDFEALIEEYNEDEGMETNPDGYIFDKDANYVQTFKDKSFELAVGEIGIAESEYGIHIIKKYPADDEITFELVGAEALSAEEDKILSRIIDQKRQELEDAGKIVVDEAVMSRGGFPASAVFRSETDSE